MKHFFPSVTVTFALMLLTFFGAQPSQALTANGGVPSITITDTSPVTALNNIHLTCSETNEITPQHLLMTIQFIAGNGVPGNNPVIFDTSTNTLQSIQVGQSSGQNGEILSNPTAVGNDQLKFNVAKSCSAGDTFTISGVKIKPNPNVGDVGTAQLYLQSGSGNQFAYTLSTSTFHVDTVQKNPTGTVVINNGANLTETIFVNAQVTSVNANQVQFATRTDMSDAGSYEAITTNRSITLKPFLGTQNVCVRFRNSTTNTVSGISCDTIELRSDGLGVPTNMAMALNNDAGTTTSNVVTLNIRGSATRMAISNSSDFANATWQTFISPASWTLTQGIGNKTVYALFAADNGSVTKVIQDSILRTQNGTVIISPPQLPFPPRVIPTGLFEGMLVKRAGFTAVYYVGADGYRYVFPHQKVFLSWYTLANLNVTTQGGQVYVVSDELVASLPIGGNVTYRPGTRMIKIESDNKVYAVDQGGILRFVVSPDVATSLYGSFWNTFIDDINVAFFNNYGFGTDINSSSDYNPNTARNASPTINEDKGIVGL